MCAEIRPAGIGPRGGRSPWVCLKVFNQILYGKAPLRPGPAGAGVHDQMSELVLLGENCKLAGEHFAVLGGVLYHPGRLRVRGEKVIRGGLVGKDVDSMAAEAVQRTRDEGHRRGGVQQEEHGTGKNKTAGVEQFVIHRSTLIANTPTVGWEVIRLSGVQTFSEIFYKKAGACEAMSKSATCDDSHRRAARTWGGIRTGARYATVTATTTISVSARRPSTDFVLRRGERVTNKGSERLIAFSIPDAFSIGGRQPKQPAPGSDFNGKLS